MSFAFDFPLPPNLVETKSLFDADDVPTRGQCLHILVELAALEPALRRRVLAVMPPLAVRALAEEWSWQVHGGQEEPAAGADGAPWRVWAIVAGRGFGKTRAGAEWVWERARQAPGARIALVGSSFDEVERVMVTGESGLLACARGHERPRWLPAKRILRFPSGAEAHAFTAEKPEKLRGPQHHFAWCDELAKWPRADDTWNNLMLGLRLGERPRTIVTTTPKPLPLLKRILALPRCARTDGRTDQNPHLPADFRAAVEAMFGGTRLGRQELQGLLLEEFEGALWTREMLETARGVLPEPARGGGPGEAGWRGNSESALPLPHDGSRRGPPPLPLHHAAHGPPPPASWGRNEEFVRIVIGLDPPASTGGDACGIVVCGRDKEGIVWVIADLSAPGLSPEAWARRVVDAAGLYGAGRVVAEKNQGGDLIASNLRAVDSDLPVELVHAGPSKATRAEPIALRFETGRGGSPAISQSSRTSCAR
jgi:phage terminase large subunit-like protein